MTGESSLESEKMTAGLESRAWVPVPAWPRVVSPGLLHSSVRGQLQGGLVPIQFQPGQCLGHREPCQLHSRVDQQGT